MLSLETLRSSLMLCSGQGKVGTHRYQSVVRCGVGCLQDEARSQEVLFKQDTREVKYWS